jgi:Tfp pilus assembly protein PilX
LTPGRIRRDGGARGFALIIVLWGLVLIGLLITHLTAAGRMDTHITANLLSNASAAAAADGAVTAAIYHFLDPDERQRWAADGEDHAVTIGASTVTVRMFDEAGRVNPNLASEPGVSRSAGGLAAGCRSGGEPGR